MGFALFQPRPEPLPEAAVAEAFSRVPRLAHRDAARAAAEANGVLLDGLERDEAEVLAGALAAYGVRIGQDDWLAPLAAQITRRLRLDSEALVMLDAYGGEQRIADRDVLLLACGQLPELRPTPRMQAPPKDRRERRDLASAVLGEPEPAPLTRAVLDLVVRGPVRRYRIEADGFDYACLGARKQPGAARNFEQLVARLGERLTSAQRNRGTSELIAHRRLFAYASEAGFERETSFWLWKLHGGELERCERAASPKVAAAELDPAVLLASPADRRPRAPARLVTAIAQLLVLLVLGLLLLLLNRL